MLRLEGYEVEVAANGRELLDKFDPRRVDLVLLDLDMPVTNGWDALEELLAIQPDQAVIIITGKTEPCEWTSAARAAILLAKPINVPQLLDSMREALVESAPNRKERTAAQQRLTRHTRPLPDTCRWRGSPPWSPRTCCR